MNRTMTRLLSPLVTAALIFGLAPSVAFAAPSGTGAQAVSKTAVSVEALDDGSSVYSDYSWTDRAAERDRELRESERAYAAISGKLAAAKREHQQAHQVWTHPTSYDEEVLYQAERRYIESIDALNELVNSVPTAALVDIDNYPITVYATDYNPDNPPVTETVEIARSTIPNRARICARPTLMRQPC